MPTLKAITKLGLASRFRTMTPPSSSPEPTGATKWFRGVSLARCRSAASFSPRACVDGRHKSEVAPRRMPGRNVSAEQRWIDLCVRSRIYEASGSPFTWWLVHVNTPLPLPLPDGAPILPCWAAGRPCGHAPAHARSDSEARRNH